MPNDHKATTESDYSCATCETRGPKWCDKHAGLLIPAAPKGAEEARAACGVTFSHKWHGHLDGDGRTRVCDGEPLRTPPAKGADHG